MVALMCFVLAVLALPFKSKSRLEAENAALRHQLIVLRRKVRGRAQLSNNDRWFFVQLYRWFPETDMSRLLFLKEVVESVLVSGVTIRCLGKAAQTIHCVTVMTRSAAIRPIACYSCWWLPLEGAGPIPQRVLRRSLRQSARASRRGRERPLRHDQR